MLYLSHFVSFYIRGRDNNSGYGLRAQVLMGIGEVTRASAPRAQGLSSFVLLKMDRYQDITVSCRFQ